ncbi:metallophosphoesterase family protein [Dactylosporangium sp. AC04546]|uniref:metallophosphoesterase family protein n=1 Tax=Dactylosporangium sp. AC04546 TaxID=2862460 RepID=UPI001EE0651C|nr:metallophosphoesterase family protein [Dactylosporangium sp. AC04546]WVK80012.1 metallophosphoesterase family protein [Dactylosporangium sp. AC04546]
MARTVVVGDIHGCHDELTALLDRARVRPEDLLVSVGDLVDRGPDPGGVVRLFRERPNSVAVMGNHERKHVRGVFSYAQEVTRLQLGDGYADAVGWMRTLPYCFENEHVRVVHAALVPGEPLDGQPEELLCGSTSGERELAARFPGSYWHEHYTDAKPVVFGHHVAGPEPLVRDGRVYGLDTGACHGWNLTALSLPDRTLYAVPASADHWAAVRRDWQLPVLRTRPWLDLAWPDLERALERAGRTGSVPALQWLAAVAAWAGDLRSLFPDLAAAAVRAAGGRPPEELRRHPAAQVLFQARDGRLDAAAVARRCLTPRRVLDLAAALSVAAPSLPA